MDTFVALLRAVNVGGHRSVPMAELCELQRELGRAHVETHARSGNVVSDALARPPARAALD